MTDCSPPKSVTKEQLQLARCAFLDTFADAEIAFARLASRIGQKTCGTTVGQRLESLRSVKPCPSFSKGKVQSLNVQLDRLQRINAVRADIVHARMAVAPIAGQMRACFINSMAYDCEAPVARLVTRDEFAKLNRELTEIATALAAL